MTAKPLDSSATFLVHFR